MDNSGHMDEQRREETAPSRQSILYVDDRAAIDAVSSVVESEYDDLSITGETNRKTARERVARESFDCVVTELKFATAVSDVLGDTPLVLFTETDSTAISDDLLEQADTLVQKGEQTHIDFLVDKIRGVITEESTTSQWITAQMPDARTEFFHLDASEQVQWASAPVTDVFPATVNETTDGRGLHERLGTASTGTYNFTERVVTAELNGAPVERVGLEIPRDSPPSEPDTVTYCCWSYPYGNGKRIEAYRDVTAAIQQTERLDRLERLVELASDGLYMLDPDARYTFVTDRYAEMLGYERRELLGRHASTVMSEGALEQGQRAVRSLLDDPARERAVIDQPHVRKDGERIDLSIHFTVLTDDEGSYGGLMGVARDVTKRRRREQKLAKYETIFETVRDRVFVLDGDGRITLANEPFTNLIGWERSAIEDGFASDVLGSRVAQTLEDLHTEIRATGDEHGATEVELPDENGAMIPCEVTLSQLPDGSDRCVGVVRDVSERVQRERQVAVLDRVLRHNLRNDLTVVLGRADLLADRTTDEETREMVETIRKRSNRLLEFAEKARRAQQVLDHVLTHSSARAPIEELVEGVANRIREAHAEVTVSNELPSGARVTVPQTLRVALKDLATNAIEHNDRPDPWVEITVRRSGETLAVAVADNGPGIPGHERGVLIDGTDTPLKHGSGIGFWLVHWIVTQHGGELRIDDREPRGSVVRLLLPWEAHGETDI